MRHYLIMADPEIVLAAVTRKINVLVGDRDSAVVQTRPVLPDVLEFLYLNQYFFRQQSGPSPRPPAGKLPRIAVKDFCNPIHPFFKLADVRA